jgi:ATP-dependent DNA helicase RecG
MSSDARPAPAAELSTPIQFIKGCGPARAELLAKLGLATLRDLLFFFSARLPGPGRRDEHRSA